MTIAVVVGLGVVFQGPILDTLVQSDNFAGYGYCSDFDSCRQASEQAGGEVVQIVGEDLAKDCLRAHTAALSRLTYEQNAKERVGFCVVTAAVLNERIGAQFWTLPWLANE
ncbi:hypothetical protein [Agromyces humi]|uniref:hypothetical protein n=1 Tax=Agromyces humi TaxID=1766800 RepID=UPI001357CA76|nr:hypothetical protein [Agromyces humi]